MYKILTFDCKISELEEKEIHISYTASSFDCFCKAEHELVSTICPSPKLNLVGFPRNYFESTNCSCVFISKDEICKQWQYLKTSTNFFVPKVCFGKKLLPKDFEVEKIDQYLIEKLHADQIFYFSKEINKIKTSIYSIDCDDLL